jgi:transglutaminase-like putative cysteine protease
VNRYNLVHVTNFAYDGPVSESYNELRLRPRHDESQSCLSFRVLTNPSAKAIGHRDFYGNWVHVFHILREHRTLRVETEAVVLMHPQRAQHDSAVQQPARRPLRLSFRLAVLPGAAGDPGTGGAGGVPVGSIGIRVCAGRGVADS